MVKPIALAYSPLTGRIYASTNYTNNGKYLNFKTKEDVTDQIGHIISVNNITFDKD